MWPDAVQRGQDSRIWIVGDLGGATKEHPPILRAFQRQEPENTEASSVAKENEPNEEIAARPLCVVETRLETHRPRDLVFGIHA